MDLPFLKEQLQTSSNANKNLRQEPDVFYKIYCKSHYSVNKL